jgi:SAM-dependent methyltransferase
VLSAEYEGAHFIDLLSTRYSTLSTQYSALSTDMDSTKRFSKRVESYIKYRPKYPPEVLEFLKTELGFTISSVIADIGSGTGISCEMFLNNGNSVFGIEPNAEMREAAEKGLRSFSNFVSIDGKAEATTLQNHSIDFVVAGQAFHWFDREQSRKEFLRILKPNGWVVLLWNDRKQDTSFSNAYENLLKTFAIDYEVVDHRLLTEDAFRQFFGGSHYGVKMFDNEQIFDLEGLKGRVLSCSYMPMPDHPHFDEMMAALEKLFERFQQNDAVTMNYQTLMYYGRLKAGEH